VIKKKMLAMGHPEYSEFNEEFKAKVAIEAIRGLKALTEISLEYELHQNKISK